MTYPERIRLSRARGRRLPEGAVNCARPGPWGNPFRVGQDGDAEACVRLHWILLGGHLCVDACPTIDEQRRIRDHVKAHLAELRGHDLACWCKLGHWCHADTLLALANGPRPVTGIERYILDRIAGLGEGGDHMPGNWRADPDIKGLVRALLLAPHLLRHGRGEALTITPHGRQALELANP